MSNIQTQSWLIDRRHALRAMGTCIALPMLECMIPLNGQGENQLAATQCLYLPGQRRAFAQLPDHQAGQGLPILTLAQAAGEIP